MAWFGRSRGISLLVPTQNAETTVEMCIRSFADFPDEMIVVDNGSTDGTKDIVRELEKEYEQVTFYDVPDLKDLYENRQYAYERSRFDWIMRIDSDYVAHTDGEYNIQKLREFVLHHPRTWIPTALGITQVNLVHDFLHTGIPGDKEAGSHAHAEAPVSTLAARIVQWYPGLKFCRLGRWEGVRFQKRLRHEGIDIPYWFHCSFRTKDALLVRFFRTRWREHGDFNKYPTLHDYVVDQAPVVFGTEDLHEAAERHYAQNLLPYLQRYDPEEYYAYPRMIADHLAAQDAATQKMAVQDVSADASDGELPN